MKKYITSIVIGTLALTLVMSPLASFAKEKGENGNKGGNSVKIEKVVKAENTNSKEKSSSTSQDRDNDNDRKVSASEKSCYKAYGHLFAPGWFKHNSTSENDLK